MKSVLKFILERVSLIQYGILIIAFLSAGFSVFNIHSFMAGFISLYLFFAVLRMMDDLKDYSKDKVANKDRPLPRGAVTKENLELGVTILLGFMLLVSGGLFFWAKAAGLLYAAITCYLYLMYKEFFIGEKLNKYQILYGLSHQLIVIPIALFSYSVYEVDLVLNEIFSGNYNGLIFYAAASMAGFFQYEILRKMNPKAHPVLGQYLTVYGYNKVLLFTLTLMSCGIFFSFQYGGQIVIAASSVVTLCFLAVQKYKPEIFKITEGVVSISLFFHLFSYYLVSLGI